MQNWHCTKIWPVFVAVSSWCGESVGKGGRLARLWRPKGVARRGRIYVLSGFAVFVFSWSPERDRSRVRRTFWDFFPMTWCSKTVPLFFLIGQQMKWMKCVVTSWTALVTYQTKCEQTGILLSQNRHIKPWLIVRFFPSCKRHIKGLCKRRDLGQLFEFRQCAKGQINKIFLMQVVSAERKSKRRTRNKKSRIFCLKQLGKQRQGNFSRLSERHVNRTGSMPA